MSDRWRKGVLVVLGAGLLCAVAGCGKSAPRTVVSPKAAPTPVRAGQVEYGLASWYGKKYHGRKTASGEKYNMRAMTAAHRTLPFGTKVRVVHLASKRSVVVRINDRGPWKEERIIDLSRKAAQKLGIIEAGLAQVRIEVLR
jgi:rare lipoprotein A